MSSFKHKTDKKYFTVTYNGKVFIKIKKDIFLSFLKDKFGIILVKALTLNKMVDKTKLDFVICKDGNYFKIYYSKKLFMMLEKNIIVKVFNNYFFNIDASDSKVDKFITFYTKEYKRVTKRKFAPDYTNDKKSHGYFVKTVELINKHNVSFKNFMESQIQGLKFVKQKNFFPRPYNLCTNESEIRLMDYLDNKKSVSNDEIEIFSLADIDLQNNKKYKKYLKLVKNKEADFEQTSYVFSLQKSCLDNIDKDVKDYFYSF